MMLAKTITNIAILSNKRKRWFVQVFPFSWSSSTKAEKPKVERVMSSRCVVRVHEGQNKREILVFLYLVRFDFLLRLHLSYMNTLLFERSC